MRKYPVPWREVFALTPHIWRRSRYDLSRFTRESVKLLQPSPLLLGLENLPDEPGFVLAPNHYQRPGLWILHPCSLLTVAIEERYKLEAPAVRWVVTANWPPIAKGIPSPGDWLLPRVAHALHCYPVAFAGTNPALTASSYRRMLRELDRPLGLFLEGVAGSAGKTAEPLPGVERLLMQLANRGAPVLPVGIKEEDRLIVRFGEPIQPAAILSARAEAARLVMAAISRLVRT